MNLPPDDAAWSGLLDGELPTPQAEALRERIDADPQRAEQYRRLSSLDHRWMLSARTAQFPVQVHLPLPDNSAAWWAWLAPLLLVVTVARTALHLSSIDLMGSLMLQAALLIMIILVVIRLHQTAPSCPPQS